MGNPINDLIALENERAAQATGATEVSIDDLKKVQTRSTEVEVIPEGAIFDISGVTTLIKRPVSANSRNFMYFANVPYSMDLDEDGKLKNPQIGTWFPTSFTKVRTQYSKNTDGTIVRGDRVKAKGDPCKVYQSKTNMSDSIKAVQKENKLIKVKKYDLIQTLDFADRTNLIDTNIGTYEFV